MRWVKMFSRKNYLHFGMVLAGALVIIMAAMFSYYFKIQNKEYLLQVESLKDFSNQGSALVERKLNEYLSVLRTAADFVDTTEIHSEANMQHLRDIVEHGETDFVRMGLIDAEGNSLVTNGGTLQAKDNDYFKKAMQGESNISENRKPIEGDQPVFLATVPLRDEDGNTCGALYGVVETDSFWVYADVMEGSTSRYFRVVDQNGEYILRDEKVENPVLQEGNLFDGLRGLRTDIAYWEAQNKMESNEEFQLEITKKGEKYIAWFSPLGMGDWYVVTVMNREDIDKSVDFLLGSDVYVLIFEVMIAVGILGFVILRHLQKEREQLTEMYEQVKVNDELLRAAVESSKDLIMIYTPGQDILRILNPWNRLIKLPSRVEKASENMCTYLPSDGNMGEQLEKIFYNLKNTDADVTMDFKIWLYNRFRSYKLHMRKIKDSSGKVMECMGVLVDVTEQVNLQQRAERDFLTGLYNRQSAADLIENYLQEQRGHESQNAFLIMDLDYFKDINDTLGHQTGDLALQDVAETMTHHFRQEDIICRLGGDEFVVFVKNISRETMERNATSLLKKLARTYEGNGESINVTASIGIAMSPGDGENFVKLYHKADRALYRVKESGKNAFRFYQEEDERK